MRMLRDVRDFHGCKLLLCSQKIVFLVNWGTFTPYLEAHRLVELRVFTRKELERQVAQLTIHGDASKALFLCAAAIPVERYGVECHFAGFQNCPARRAKREKSC